MIGTKFHLESANVWDVGQAKDSKVCNDLTGKSQVASKKSIDTILRASSPHAAGEREDHSKKGLPIGLMSKTECLRLHGASYR